MAAAEALISTIGRAFYDDDVVCLIDVLLRDKYLRDDDMLLICGLPPAVATLPRGVPRGPYLGYRVV